MLPSDFVSKGTALSCCCRGGVEHLQAGMCLGMLNMRLCPHLGWQGLASCSSHPLHLSGSLVHPLSLLEGTGVRTSVFFLLSTDRRALRYPRAMCGKVVTPV